MVGYKPLAVVLCMLVLLSIAVVALPLSPNLIKQNKQAELQKEKPQLVQSQIAINAEKTSAAKKNNFNNQNNIVNQQLENKNKEKDSKKGGSGFTGQITASGIYGTNFNSIQNFTPQTPAAQNASQLCNTPGFSCGGAPGTFIYGTGDTVNYFPRITENLPIGNDATWWAYTRWFESDYFNSVFDRTHRPPAYLLEDYPDFYSGENTGFGDPSGGHPADWASVEFGPCITSAIEGSVPSSPWYPDYGPNYVAQQTQGVMRQCGVLQSQVYRAQCALSSSPAWAGNNGDNMYYPSDAYWLNPYDVNDNYILTSNAISRFGEYAWCDTALHLAQPLAISVNNMGIFNATWTTDMLAADDANNSKLTFTPVFADGTRGTPVTFNGTATSHALSSLAKNHSISGHLDVGNYSVNGTSCTFRMSGEEINPNWLPTGDRLRNCVADEGYPAGFKLRDAAGRNERILVVTAPLERPTITFIAPTPPSLATQSSDSVTIAINSSVPLNAANVTINPLGGSRINYTMTSTSPTTFTVTISGLEPAIYTYFVTATNGLRVITATRTFTINVAAPTVIFTTPPTPVNGATLASDSATVTISTSVPVSSSTLRLTRPDGTSAVYDLTETTPTSCTGSITGLRAGVNTYYVEATSTTGTRGTSTVQTFTVPGPSVTFTASTPASGSSQTSTSATVSISSNEPLVSATLVWTDPLNAVTEYAMTSTSSTTFTHAVSSLELGTHSYFVRGVDDEGDVANTATRTLIVSTVVVTPPVITLVSPTPSNAATLSTDGAIVAISSSEALASATLHLTRPDGTNVDLAMGGSGTSYSVSLIGLRAGTNTYYVTAVDSDEGASGRSSTRTFTVPLPIVTFTPPTPVNGATSTPGTLVSIQVSSNEPLISAVFVLTDPASVTTEYTMTSLSSTSFTYSFSPSVEGAYAYRVDVVDNEGDATTSETRGLTVSTVPVVSPVIT
ncbi:MAG: hypothetical protein Q8R15_00575, partial [Candidatus Micrarchaeota archaeon]|nr:hypothetical protein [Candidatus Micrarchaeota archaeon]